MHGYHASLVCLIACRECICLCVAGAAWCPRIDDRNEGLLSTPVRACARHHRPATAPRRLAPKNGTYVHTHVCIYVCLSVCRSVCLSIGLPSCIAWIAGTWRANGCYMVCEWDACMCIVAPTCNCGLRLLEALETQELWLWPTQIWLEPNSFSYGPYSYGLEPSGCIVMASMSIA